MDSINNFLDKFKKFTLPNESIRKATKKVLDEHIPEGLDIKNVSYKNGTVFLKIDPTQKSFLILRKEEILNEINQNLGKEIVKDFR